jgi:hypothetical protein
MTMHFSDAVPMAWQILTEHALVQCAEAGFGRIETADDGTSRFEAYPGQENAAADFVKRALLAGGNTQ